MVMMEEQPSGQPPVNRKKDIAPAGVQAEALGKAASPVPSPSPMPSPIPSPSPTPHPGQALLDDYAKKGFYDPAAGKFQGLGALSALNAEARKSPNPPPWLVEMINAYKGGTPFSLAPKKGAPNTNTDIHARKQSLGKE